MATFTLIIILITNSGVEIEHIPFKDQQSCMVAASQLKYTETTCVRN